VSLPSKLYRVARNFLAGGALFAATAAQADAQHRLLWQRHGGCDPCASAPCALGTAVDPASPVAPVAPDAAPAMPLTEPALAPITTAALGDTLSGFGPGYLDNAVPFTHFRMRFDGAFGNNRPDRAEFFYAKCGCFGNTPGPLLEETGVDYQDISSYLEIAPTNRFSVFVEFPYRFINPDRNANTSGWADMNAGFKYALVRNCRNVLTFQNRFYFPTGDPRDGLGTDHVSIEPSLLLASNLSDRLQFFGQFGDWIPVDGTDFAGNILLYGAGLSYTVVDTGSFRAAPVAEVLGWTVLDGQLFAFPEGRVEDASGDTIVNAKIGVRFGFGGVENPGLLSNSDLYVGYGRALTGDVWYKDIVRIEYRIRF
jgi:hypothetical protein